MPHLKRSDRFRVMRKHLLRLLCVLGFIFVLNMAAQAATPIEDPQGLLARIENTRAPRSFADAFRVGDEATVRILNRSCFSLCTDFFGLRICAPICREPWEPGQPDLVKRVSEVTSTEATSVFSDGTTEVVEASTFLADRGSQLRKSIRELDQLISLSGVAKLVSLKEVDFALADQSTVPAYDLRGEFWESEGGVVYFHYIVGKQVPGVAEILSLSLGATAENLDNGEASKIFKVRAIRGARR